MKEVFQLSELLTVFVDKTIGLVYFTVRPKGTLELQYIGYINSILMISLDSFTKKIPVRESTPRIVLN